LEAALMKHRSNWLSPAVALIAAVGSGAGAQGSFPEKPIRLIVPVAAGGGIDSAFRVIAPQWSAPLGQTVAIENRTGAGQTIGIDAVLKSAPGGYTLAGVGVRTERAPVLTKVATRTEQGLPMYDGALIYGVVGPAGMKPAIPAKLNDTLVGELHTSETQTKLAEMGFDVVASTTEAYGRKIGAEIERWSCIVRENNIKIE